MRVRIVPNKTKDVEIKIPASRTYLHCAIVLASLSQGRSVLTNTDISEDVLLTVRAMRTMGAVITGVQGTIIIDGINGFKTYNGKEIETSTCSSTLRFLMPLMSLTEQEVIFNCEESLMLKSLSLYEHIFDGGLTKNENQIIINKKIEPGEYTIPADTSSQFVTGLLITLPLLEGNSKLMFEEPIGSLPYIEMILKMMGRFGVHLKFENNVIEIVGNQQYQSHNEIIEGDYSLFAFIASLGIIYGDNTGLNLNHDSLQGDRIIVDIIKSMGGSIEEVDGGYRMRKSKLHGITVDLNTCSNLSPCVMMLAAVAQGETHIINLKRLLMRDDCKVGEMITELQKVGVNVRSNGDELIIEGKDSIDITQELTCHQDYSVLMAIATLATISKTEVVINYAECVYNVFPGFYNDLVDLGVKVEKNVTV